MSDTLKERMEKLRKINPHWSDDKIRYVAMYDMPRPKGDGWED